MGIHADSASAHQNIRVQCHSPVIVVGVTTIGRWTPITKYVNVRVHPPLGVLLRGACWALECYCAELPFKWAVCRNPWHINHLHSLYRACQELCTGLSSVSREKSGALVPELSWVWSESLDTLQRLRVRGLYWACCSSNCMPSVGTRPMGDAVGCSEETGVLFRCWGAGGAGLSGCKSDRSFGPVKKVTARRE